MYQNLAQQLMPWVVKAEKYCATELPKCSSMEEAKDLYDLHQVRHAFTLAIDRECGSLADVPEHGSAVDALGPEDREILQHGTAQVLQRGGG